MVAHSFKDLMIWQKAVVLVGEIYRLTKKFPKEELYGLVSQIRRSAISVPSNIAEGFVRKHNKEFMQFLNIALGSLAELETQLILSKELLFISQNDIKNLEDDIDHLGRMITKFRQTLSD